MGTFPPTNLHMRSTRLAYPGVHELLIPSRSVRFGTVPPYEPGRWMRVIPGEVAPLASARRMQAMSGGGSPHEVHALRRHPRRAPEHRGRRGGPASGRALAGA